MVNIPDFDRRVAVYARHARMQQQAAAWLAEWLPDRIDGPALELGAGTGFFTRHIMSSAPALRATDISPRMVEAGRADLPDADWMAADASDPPTGARPYSAILSCSLIQWLPDPASAFRRWHQISAPGAVFLSGWFVRGTLDNFLEVFPESAPFPWRSSEEWQSLLPKAGWRVRRCETKVFRAVHSSSVEMLREIHQMGAVVSRRMGAGRLRAVLREIDHRNRGAAGLVTPFVFLRVEALRS